MGTQEKLQVGTVVSNKMDKTVVVRIDRYKRHRLYGKSMKVTQRYKAHDENNECRLGDIVRISETRPLSREKRWRIVEVITKGDVAEIAPREIGAHILEETKAAADIETAARLEREAAERAASVAEVATAVEPDEADSFASDAVAAPQIEAGTLDEEGGGGESPSVEIVDDTPMAPAEQIEQLAEDAEETREESSE
jgi:small subunit ribosomal protein S17